MTAAISAPAPGDASQQPDPRSRRGKRRGQTPEAGRRPLRGRRRTGRAVIVPRMTGLYRFSEIRRTERRGLTGSPSSHGARPDHADRKLDAMYMRNTAHRPRSDYRIEEAAHGRAADHRDLASRCAGRGRARQQRQRHDPRQQRRQSGLLESAPEPVTNTTASSDSASFQPAARRWQARPRPVPRSLADAHDHALRSYRSATWPATSTNSAAGINGRGRPGQDRADCGDLYSLPGHRTACIASRRCWTARQPIERERPVLPKGNGLAPSQRHRGGGALVERLDIATSWLI